MYGRLKEYVIHSDSEEEQEPKEVIETEKKPKEAKKNKNNMYDYDRELFEKKNKERLDSKPIKKQKFDNNMSFTEEIKEVEVKYCSICNKRVNNEAEFSKHINSKHHIKAIKSETIKEISNYPNINSYLLDKGLITLSKSNFNRVKKLLYTMTLKQFLSNK